MDPNGLRPDSFCAAYSCVPDSPAGGVSCVMLFNGPADFVAFLRAVELPWNLWAESGRASDDFTVVDPHLDALNDEQRSAVRDCQVTLDEILDQAEIGSADAGRAIDAFNRLFRPRFMGREVTFAAYGTLLETLNGVLDWLDDIGDGDVEELRMGTEGELSFLPGPILRRLLEAGPFDPYSHDHLRVARDTLWSFLASDGIEFDLDADWEWYRHHYPERPPGRDAGE